MNCSTTDCPNLRDGRHTLCSRCLKRRQRGKPLTDPGRTYGDQWEALMAAVRAYTEAEDDDFVRTFWRLSRIEDRISKAALRYAAAVRKRARTNPESTAPGQCPHTD